ncbi:MAG: type I-C CRISPR-associated protein Cas7/Csd2 [Planctomycetaceae bacterium]|jgi:CRISPR-associated protein Csd2|nr:type I-C CRISPR-associated protein Cas7/Csd2 [Planctomycetaceae bacterium]
MTNPLTNRHDLLLLFEVTNGNPNGDPDAGNMPRIDPNTNRGIVTDVCLKRKIRNFVELFPKDREKSDTGTDDKKSGNGFNILIKQGGCIETEQKNAIVKANDESNKLDGKSTVEKAKNWLCREFFDVRTFGGVLSTGDDVFKGSAFGQVRGPVQITFGQSFHPITPLEIPISICCPRNEAKGEKGQQPTEEKIAKIIIAQTGIQGRKHIVPYALYAAKCYVSPSFAEKTGFTTDDYDLLIDAILHMFTEDPSAARSEMVVRGLYDFEHIGTHADDTDGAQKNQNLRETRLGCAHAHELFEGINISLKDGKEFPESFADYEVVNTWTETTLPKGVKLHLRHNGETVLSSK